VLLRLPDRRQALDQRVLRAAGLARRRRAVHPARAERIIVEGGRAVGVTARSATGRTLTVRARAVVVACGALMTPGLLERNHLGGGSGQLGRNLSIHPAAGASPSSTSSIASWRGVPQVAGDRGVPRRRHPLRGRATPLEFTAALMPQLGRRLVGCASASITSPASG
jgi:choline dehydrogenase-like flavoprotein